MRLKERRGVVVDVERVYRQKRQLGALSAVLLLYCGAALAQGKADAGRNNANVEQAYQTHYASLRGYTTPVLIAELSETVEDALITGSHVSLTSKRSKVLHFEEAAYAALRARLCSAQDRSLSVGLKAVALESVATVSTEMGLRITSIHHGKLAALLVRVLENVGKPRFCESDNFSDLAR